MTTLTDRPTTPDTTRSTRLALQRDELLEALKADHIADYAPTLLRAVAAVVDLAILTVVCFFSAALLAHAMGYQSTVDTTTGVQTDYYLFSPALIAALVIAYFPGSWARWGCSPAMRLFGLRIRMADDLSRIDRTTALVRFGALLLSIAPALVGLLVALGTHAGRRSTIASPEPSWWRSSAMEHLDSKNDRLLSRGFDAVSGTELRDAYEDVATFVRWLEACDVRVPACWYTHGWVVRRLHALLRWYDEAYGELAPDRAAADWWLVGVMPLLRDWSELLEHGGRHVPHNAPLADSQPVPPLDEWIRMQAAGAET
jgi:uncharacterized RDD family membrane protein YckC